ncbi:MAG: hypothetical protein AAFU79_17880, partial [Myxococcota bacterium]
LAPFQGSPFLSVSGAKPYGMSVGYPISPSYQGRHHVLTDVELLTLADASTVQVAPGGRRLVPVKPNLVGRPKRKAVRYDEDGMMSIPGGAFRFDRERASVLSVAPKGLCGQGEVLAIGSWDFLLRGGRSAGLPPGNVQFLRNLTRWLSGS